MPRNQEGEFELTVGTRQLLTVVFILMVLFGVVFSMGYFVGRSSSPEAPAPAAAAAPVSAEPIGERPSAAGALAPSAAPEAPLPAATVPAQTAPPPATTAATPPAAPETKSAAVPPPAAPPPAAGPAAGQTFLQVAAVKRAEADLIVEVLKKKGFAAQTAPGPNETLFRVLVGPLADSAAVAKTKADLEQAGFRSIVRKF